MGSIDDRVSVGVGIIVVDDQHRVLLGKRIGKHGAGEWSLPGGKPDPAEPWEDKAESPSEAASRELWEETGLHIPPVMLSPVPYWSYDVFEDHGMHFVTLYFVAKLPFEQVPENIEPEKCEGWEFCSTDALPAPLFCGTQEAIRTLVRVWGGI